MYGLLVRWMITLSALTISRIFFLVRYGPWVGISVGQGIQAAIWGLRWDWTTATYLTLPLWIGIFSHKLQRSLWLLILSVAWAWEMIDLGYFAYSQHRSNADLWQVLSVWDEMKSLFFFYLKDFWGLVALWLVGLIFFSKIEKNLQRRLASQKKLLRYSFLLLPIYILGLRGGLQVRPLSLVDAYLPNCTFCGVFVYPSTFSLIKSLDQDPLPRLDRGSLPEALKYVSPLRPPSPSPFPKLPNIVLLIIESLSAEYLDSQLVPFIDSLRKQGQSVKDFYSASTRSAEGIPAILGGIPTWAGEAFIFSRYADLPIESLPLLLKKQGYTSVFFHGGYNGTMGLESFCRKIHFDAYYGLNEYPYKIDYQGGWGVPDGPFLEFFAEKISKLPEPFFAVCFTLSTHHPYTVPENYPAPRHPIEATLQYTDRALRKFFSLYKHSASYSNTLFVLTADHPGPVLNPDYYALPQNRKVPIILFHPTLSIPPLRSIGSQIDILPTLAQVAAYPDTFFALGESLWDTTYNWAPIPINPSTFGAVDKNQFISLTLEELPNASDNLAKHLRAHLIIYYTALTQNALTYKRWKKKYTFNTCANGCGSFSRFLPLKGPTIPQKIRAPCPSVLFKTPIKKLFFF